MTNTYDALGRMVENNAGGTYTEFVYGPTGTKLAKVNGTTLIKAFVALPGGAKAIYNSTGLTYYRHSDWLGSSRLTSTQARGLYSSTAYAPFGEQYATSGTRDASSAGQDQDTISSLYDFPARRHSPSQSRWISPDPAGRGAVILATPQTWNLYAYVISNPLSFVDPTGMNLDNTCSGAAADGGCGGDGGDPGLGRGPGSGTPIPPTPVGIPGFCDANACCNVNGVPWSFGPGYITSTISGTANIMAGQVRYLSILKNGWDPELGINWNDVNYLAQANAQYNRLSNNLSVLFGDTASADPTNCDLIGGHCNFALTCTDWSSCGPGRYDDGVHIENVDGALWVHDDTVSPWTGQFTFGALFTGNSWEHGFVDLIGGTFFVGAFPQ